jgi:uncharacterized membrane protein YphA (DoxX/SURF4 family)
MTGTKTIVKSIVYWLVKLIPAIILLQTLFFKFSASPESVYIFTTVGIEPWGRILTGCVELIAAVLLLVPRFSFYGAFLAAGVMFGAIISHFTILGIEIMDDGGLLFLYAMLVFVFSLVVIYIEKQKINDILKFVSRSVSQTNY